jgi:hypothetical protein
MSFYDDRFPERENLQLSTQRRFRSEGNQTGTVFSANGSYNPTSLAVQNSLKEIFDPFHMMVTTELREAHTEEDDPPF